MAGTGQSGVQVGRRKPVIQGGPAEESLSGSPRAGCGRLPEVTSGCFVEVKQEAPALSIGQLWSDPKGGCGSAATVRRQWEQPLAGLGCRVADPPMLPAAERQVPRYSGQPPEEPANVRYRRPPTFAGQIRATATDPNLPARLL